MDNRYEKSIEDVTILQIGDKRVLIIPANHKRDITVVVHSWSFDAILRDIDAHLTPEEEDEVSIHLKQHGTYVPY